MKVVWAAEARLDLRRIAAYVAQESPIAAGRLVERIIAAADALGRTPEAFAAVGRYQAQKLRRRVLGSYAIFYAVQPDRVLIVHILHGAQNYEALLFPDDEPSGKD